jgi:adenine-specific DNA-methyltransferase
MISLLSKEEYVGLYNSDSNRFDDDYIEVLRSKYEQDGYVFVLPIDPKGIKRVWRWSPGTLKMRMMDVFVIRKSDGYIIKVKDRLDNKAGLKPKSVWYKAKYTAALGTALLKAILGDNDLFSYPKIITYRRGQCSYWC